MSRGTVTVDRIAALFAAIVLLAAGAGAIAWWYQAFSWLPERLDVSAARDAAASSWWPWALGVGGLLLIVLGLVWLAAHLPGGGIGELRLPGSDATGRLRAAAAPVAAAAAESLRATPGVHSASGGIRRERGQLVARLSATLDDGADLAEVAAAADVVTADLARVTGRDDLFHQVRLRLATRSRALPRVS